MLVKDKNKIPKELSPSSQLWNIKEEKYWRRAQVKRDRSGIPTDVRGKGHTLTIGRAIIPKEAEMNDA